MSKYKELKRQPLRVATEMTLTELRTTLRELDYAYHDKNAPSVTDKVYDIIRQVYDARAKKPYAKVGTISSHIARRVKLPVVMGSLRNYKSGSSAYAKLLSQGPFVISDKEDGISLTLVYKKGILVQALQRGDGTTGTDSSGVIPMLSVPERVKGDMTVRVEFTMNTSTFKKMFDSASGGQYDNARNGSGGLLSKNAADPRIKKMKCVAHEITSGTFAGKPLSKQFAYLKKLGFHVVPHKVYAELDESIMSKRLAERKSKALRLIDGIVVAQDKSYTPGSKLPDHAFAYKENSVDSMVKVKVLEVEWNATRYGKLQPRIVIKPTRIGGVTVQYLTGHNAFFIENGYISAKKNKPPYAPRPINVGATLLTVRSGDVIPDVVEVLKGASRPSQPAIPFTRKGVDYIATERQGGTDLKSLVHFFTAIGVDGLKAGTMKLLVAAGIDSISKIINSDAQDMESILGHTRAVKLERSILQALKTNATLPRLASGSTVFGDKFGETGLTKVFEYVEVTDSVKQVEETLLSVPGFKSKATLAAVAMPKFAKFLKLNKLKPVKAKKLKQEGTKAAKLSVLFTSVRDAEAQAWIIAQGGKLASSVKSSNLLVVKDTMASNNKTIQAEQLGITIMSIDAFRKKYKV